MKPSFYIKLKACLGDMIFVQAQLWAAKDRYEKIYISQVHNWEPQKTFFEMIFCEPYFTITNDLSYPKQKIIYSLGNIHENCIPPDQNFFVPILCTNDYSNIKDTYIIISTKIRGYGIKLWNDQLKPLLIKHLLDLSKKYSIMLIGEKEIDPYSSIADDPVYTIYDDLKNNLPEEKIIDNTINNLPVSIDKMKEDCSFMHYAKKTICIGRGGNVILAYAVANHFCIAESAAYAKGWPFKKFISFDQINTSLKALE